MSNLSWHAAKWLICRAINQCQPPFSFLPCIIKMHFLCPQSLYLWFIFYRCHWASFLSMKLAQETVVWGEAVQLGAKSGPKVSRRGRFCHRRPGIRCEVSFSSGETLKEADRWEENNKFISSEPTHIHTIVVRYIWSFWHFLSILGLLRQFISISNHRNR